MADVVELLGSLLGALARIPWTLLVTRLALVLAWPLRVALRAASLCLGAVLVVCAPVIYPFAYLLSWARAALRLLAGLAPLYTFFGVAVFVGVVAGLILAVFSNYVSALLGTQGDSADERWSRKKLALVENEEDELYVDGEEEEEEEEDDNLSRGESSSGGEAELKWYKSTAARRRPASGLLSQIIHEELDSSE